MLFIGYLIFVDIFAINIFLGPIGRIVRRITLRENKLATCLLLQNLFKADYAFSDKERKKTGVETPQRIILMLSKAQRQMPLIRPFWRQVESDAQL